MGFPFLLGQHEVHIPHYLNIGLFKHTVGIKCTQGLSNNMIQYDGGACLALFLDVGLSSCQDQLLFHCLQLLWTDSRCKDHGGLGGEKDWSCFI